MDELSDIICRITGATSCQLGEEIQSLWSGYGVIQRASLVGVQYPDVVVKHIDISQSRSNRRGWGGDISHQRKVRSYDVEKSFYESFSSSCTEACRVPRFVAACEKENDSGWVIVLEDLDASGFDLRRQNVNRSELEACLRWLASFHATFMGQEADALWPVGTYWHLATRPDELDAMPEGPLKSAAGQIDQRLNEAEFQTLVHGDAKLANFCFPAGQPNRVAAVDFQYVGRGCGMKDVAYFISSCLNDQQASRQQDELLDFYFRELRLSLSTKGKGVDLEQLEGEWRRLYSFAWADFCRFLAGWSPGHWKLNGYTDLITRSVLEGLGFKS